MVVLPEALSGQIGRQSLTCSQTDGAASSVNEDFRITIPPLNADFVRSISWKS